MAKRINLTEITDMFVMKGGFKVLHDIDTPAFMRKEYDVTLLRRPALRRMPRTMEPDEKILNFLSVIKRKDIVSLPYAS